MSAPHFLIVSMNTFFRKKLPSVFLLSILLIIQMALVPDISGKESSSNYDDLSPEACATRAYQEYHAGNKKLALDLANIACEKGSSTGCYNLACYLAEEGQTERALQSLKKYFSFPVSYPIFSDAISDPQLKVLFTNDKIADALDQGNAYFACSPVTHLRLNEFNPKARYSWNGKSEKFFSTRTLPQLAVAGYSAFYDGDVNEAMKNYSDLAASHEKKYQSIALKMASIIYGRYIDTASQALAKTTAKAAISLGSDADFLKKIESTGFFPANYCK
jgi:hypothetical protein